MSNQVKWTREQVDKVWRRKFGFQSAGYDCYGTKIVKSNFGKKTHNGWDIDHIKPTIHGGTDDYDNLQPLHWKNNRQVKANKKGCKRDEPC